MTAASGPIRDDNVCRNQGFRANGRLSAEIGRCLLVLPLLLAGMTSVFAGEPTASGGTQVTQPSELELAAHQRLIDTKARPGNELGEFVTDGCSGGLSVGWQHLSSMLPDFRNRHGEIPPWQHCCIAHDVAYHRGGPAAATALESYAAREQADRTLRTCVILTGQERAPELGREYGLSEGQVASLYEVIAELIFQAVRLGGLPCSGLPWRWGYGWPPCE